MRSLWLRLLMCVTWPHTDTEGSCFSSMWYVVSRAGPSVLHALFEMSCQSSCLSCSLRPWTFLPLKQETHRCSGIQRALPFCHLPMSVTPSNDDQGGFSDLASGLGSEAVFSHNLSGNPRNQTLQFFFLFLPSKKIQSYLKT
jgi:hypothetical protein